MAETGLSLEQLALLHQVGGDAVAEPVQSWVLHAGRTTETTELVAERVRGHEGLPSRSRGEQPVAHRCRSRFGPRIELVMYESHSRSPEGHASRAGRLRGSEHTVGQAPLDGKHAPVDISEA